MSNVQSFKSRWGFHPCDYETFRKLKAIHKWFWEFLHDYAAWQRWDRKFPKNRRGTEPTYCPEFHKYDWTWVDAYQRARRPMPKPASDMHFMDEVVPLYYSVDQINQMYFRCLDFNQSYLSAK